VSTASLTDVDVVRAGFEAFGRGDLAAFAERFHPDATWNHRNPDRLGGVHDGIEAILEFIEESGRLTAGTLRAEPQAIMADGRSHVAVVTRVSGSRPDGRTFDDRQVLVFAVRDERVHAVDQYVGDPPAVTAFWA
jgi:ketosteroid isomerase-like protein